MGCCGWVVWYCKRAEWWTSVCGGGCWTERREEREERREERKERREERGERREKREEEEMKIRGKRDGRKEEVDIC